MGATEIVQGNHNAIPDVEFRLGATKLYAELKTVLTPHAQNRNGVAKMTLTEFDAMQGLPSNHVKLLIVDIRAHSGPGHAYFVIPWPVCSNPLRKAGCDEESHLLVAHAEFDQA